MKWSLHLCGLVLLHVSTNHFYVTGRDPVVAATAAIGRHPAASVRLSPVTQVQDNISKFYTV